MDNIYKFGYDFLLMFLLILVIYIVFINRRKKSYFKLKKSDEVKIFMARYNLDIKKQNYKKILNAIAIINSFIIAFTSTLVINIEKFIWKILICFIVIFTLIYALYELAGRYFKKMEEKKNV